MTTTTPPAGTDHTTPTTALVLGGGALGVSIATHLARAGARVTLATSGELCDGASGRSLSWLNSAGDRSPAYHALRVLGVDRYRTLFAAGPSRDWLRFTGGLWWGDEGDREGTHARHADEVARGYDSHLLTRKDVAGVFPGVNAEATAEESIWNPGEGWVSLPHLVDHLATELRTLGGTIRTQLGECSLLVEDGRAAGIRDASGAELRADAVVVACGAGTSAVMAGAGVDIPDGSPLAMLVTTEPSDAQAPVLNTPRAAMRPNPGGTFCVDHDWYVDQIVEHEDGHCTIDESVVTELLAEASRLLADGTPLKAGTWASGRKPIPADGQPVLGTVGQLPGSYVAFTHSGATLALIIGDLITHEVMSGSRHPLLESFSPDRFTA
ncbi:FAD-binding oxidoreductase [Brachybacterium sp. ACRRE]|uniref:NAD(P)/FAD-dependent oxidoreductase n=1 Tax=Brachybacterium sp. ACRRE TaxID=2918184 RepID=UPI001EF19A4C|nr:FAD-binding oxidoreductase [Brachybacterium sp. ACRRE]MCG7310714.1 FAD-binding oxidoreductase [Brachybacterium sp. ACRRE]